MSITCRSCRAHLCSSSDAFFFDATAIACHLSIRPEIREAVFDATMTRVVESKKKVRIKCRTCGFGFGCDLPFGPDGSWFVAMACDKVAVGETVFSKKDRWRDCSHLFPDIARRDPQSFYGEMVETEAVVRPDPAPPVMPEPTIQSHFVYSDVLTSSKMPREAQVRAYIEGLLRDCVVVLPTGCGKTLIASLLMARFRTLNPAKLVVMVVDRIPLVYQQAE
ncbi:hypothetical protein B484DRAFT_257615, partial [Ochromonadaceae sp. CCMP2298]